MKSLKVFAASSLVCAAVCNAQTAADVRSPETLAHYVESQRAIDWKVLRNVLGANERDFFRSPCGTGASACTTQIEPVTQPDQAILIIRGGEFSYAVEYLRYLRDPVSEWKFAGEYCAYQNGSPSHHEFLQFGNKPFLKITSDHSQIGFATQQILEEWLDLTQPDFSPVFSTTIEGGQSRFGFGVGRTLKPAYKIGRNAGTESIEETLKVSFDGPDSLKQESTFVGVYQRSANEKKFTLRNAYSGSDRSTAIPTKDFEELADPFSDLSNEELLAYAFTGLQTVATSSDADGKEWLRSVLEYSGDTPEKRALLQLLGPGRPEPPRK